MSTLFQGHFVQFFDGNGKPLSGGTVDFYAPGTSTPKDVYTDAALSTPAGNPVTLDSEGRATLWLNGDYKVRLKKSDGTVVKTTDNVNPPVDTETSGGNLIANGSFEDAGNSSTQASGWTLTAQSDGSVERITADNYDGTAALKFTSDGSGGGQADTNSFFPVSPGRSYEVSFALKCSVADIRNIVQVRYFDQNQQFLSNSTVYDEAAANPTSWELKQIIEAPPSNARFAKLRILGADQSDSTSGEAKFDTVSVVDNGTVTSTDAEINKLDGYTGNTADLNKTTDGTFLEKPGTSIDPGLSLDEWRTPNANRPTFVTAYARAETDGSSDSRIFFEVDESGGTSHDYDMNFVFSHASYGAGENGYGSISFIVPAGASYRIWNVSDPAGGNSLASLREHTL